MIFGFVANEGNWKPSDFDFVELGAPIVGLFFNVLENGGGNGIYFCNSRLATIYIRAVIHEYRWIISILNNQGLQA